MGPYSHIVIANELIHSLNLQNPKEYFWGAVAPDVRYLYTKMPRKQTHLSETKIVDLFQKFPLQRDFLCGFLIHCITDKLEVKRIIQERFPFNIIRSRITENNSTLFLEFFNVEILKPVNQLISGSNNPVFHEIGINENEVLKFSEIIDDYLKTLSADASFSLYSELGFEQDNRLKRYRKLQSLWQESWVKNNLRLLHPQVKKVNKDLASLIKVQLPKFNL